MKAHTIHLSARISRNAFRSVALTGILTITVAATALAQQPRSQNNSAMWAGGGNRLSQTNQPLAESSAANIQTNSPDATPDDDDTRYKVVPIGVLPGKTASYLPVVRSVNNRAHVTGYSLIYADGFTPKGAAGAQGFIWRDGKLEALPLLSGWPGAFAFGINDRDQVVGTANNLDAGGNLIQTAVLWEHEQPTNLGALHSGWISEALDVSFFGEVVGASASSGSSSAIPVAWYGGGIHALPLLPGEQGGVANEINARGVIVGWQYSATNTVPCLWYWSRDGYIAVDLGTLGGDLGQAYGINNSNKVVGYSLYSGNIHGPAFLWDRQQGLEALPLLPSDTDAQAYNVNDAGQIVGVSQIYDENGNFVSQRAAIWEDDTVTALQTLVPANTPPLTYNTGTINDRGEITVNATNPDGSPDALLLVPKHRKDW